MWARLRRAPEPEPSTPTAMTHRLLAIGTAIVVAAGIFIILREHRLGLERKSARQFTTPQG